MSTRKTVLTERQYSRIMAGMKHLGPETIQAYAQEKITDPAELDRIEGHLFDCEECLVGYNLAFEAHSPFKADFDAFRAKPTGTVLHPENARLVTALEHLATKYGEWKERLLRWRDLLLAKEARYGVSLTAFFLPSNQESYVQVLRSLSAPKLDVALVGPTRSTRGGSRSDADTGSDLVITVDEWLDVEVMIEEGNVTLEFDKWSETVAPLVVLAPDHDDLAGLLPDHVISAGLGKFEVRFEQVPPGSYLLCIAPSMLE